MGKVKIAVNFGKLTSLLNKIGRWDLLIKAWFQTKFDKFGRDERDRLICFLVRLPEISVDEIAECFGLSRKGIYLIASKYGIDLSRTRSVGRRCRERLECLETKAGRKEVDEVMRRVARKKKFWRTSSGRIGPLRRQQVLLDLGFSEISESYQRIIWSELRSRGIIREDCLVGVILRYGLGVDPKEFLLLHYHDRRETTLKDVFETINKKAWWRGVLRIGKDETLRLYVHELKIPLKKRGSRRSRPFPGKS